MSVYRPGNYFEALGALQATRDEVKREQKSLVDLRDSLEKRARRLEDQGRECRDTGCEDWAQYLRAAMEIWEALGVTAAWIACRRDLPSGCPGCGHQRPINHQSLEVCDECVEHQFS